VSKGKFLYIETFGCQMNVSDSSKMAALLQPLGYRSTSDKRLADLIIINTCSVRAKAEERVYKVLANLRPLKKRKKGLVFAVAGCVAQQEGERLLEKMPYLDLVLGTHSLYQLPRLVTEAEHGVRQAAVAFHDAETSDTLFPTAVATQGVTHFVTIMLGCDNYCSYCVVPYVRGRETSRPLDEILNEIREATDKGVKEVTLLGQNVNSYGVKEGKGESFALLLRSIAAMDAVERLRFTTSHPKDISPELISCFADLPKLCGHIHLPAQSGSNRILAAMNRGYTREQYLATVATLRSARPDIVISSDVIAGFPGESEEDFAATLSLMDEVGYIDLFPFVYSARPGTAAADFHEDLTYEEKQRRVGILIEKQRLITMEMHQRLVGTQQQVLVERRSKRGDQLMGRCANNRIVNFTGDPELIGSMVQLEIVEAHQNSLQGTLSDL
jgi:tRNA-2-methylthio-N6-dimethylallyladenosine synthase